MDQPTVAELDYLDSVMHKENRTDLEELEYRLLCPADRLVHVPVTGPLTFARYRKEGTLDPPIYTIPWDAEGIAHIERMLPLTAPGDVHDKLSLIVRAWHEYQRRRQEYQVRRLAIDREEG